MQSIGIDLGTTNILIYVKKKGIVLNEPSVVTLDSNTNKVLKVGNEAKEMIGKNPENITVIKPMKDGVIADFDILEVLLKNLIKKTLKRKIIRPKILICCPSEITQVEKNAIYEIATRLGAKDVEILEETKVAAIGAGIDISKPEGNMIVDIGGGTTDISILSLGEIINTKSIRIAGNTFNENIIDYVKNKYSIVIGEQTAEDLKKEIGMGSKKKKTKEITGRNINTGLPDTIEVSSDDIEDALKTDIKKIIDKIKEVLEDTLPELCVDINNKGIMLTGGSSKLEGLVTKMRKELKMPVFISDNPLTDVIEGAGIIIEKNQLIDN